MSTEDAPPQIHAHASSPRQGGDVTLETALAAIRSAGASPLAVEAFWEGDTEGWFVVLSAVCVSSSDGGPLDVHLATFSEGGDIRLFNGEVPPWPEAASAQSLGEAVSAALGVPFYFPSPAHPEDDCPRWRERHLGTPCKSCGIPLLQNQGCPWRGTCYQCHLRAEREARRPDP